MSEHNIAVEGGSSVRLKTAGKYCDRDIVVTSTGGAEDLNSELTEQEELIATLQDTLKSKASGGSVSVPIVKALIRRGIGYIDTGIDAANSNLKIEIRYEFLTMPTRYFYVIRAYVNESTNATRILYNKNTTVYNCLNSIPSKSLVSSVTKYANVVYTDVLMPESSTTFSYTTDGEKVTTSRTSGTELEGKNILLFNDSASSDDVSIKVYYLKIYDGETLVRDYVPFVAKSGECGLYDLITNQFYGNAGNGIFEAETSAENLPNAGDSTSTPTQEKTVFITENGSVEVTPDDGYTLSKVVANVNVPAGGGVLPIGYTLVPSIKFTGEQAVDTGIICNQNTQIRVVFTVEKDKGMYIYGVANADHTASITAYRSASGGRWRFGNQNIVLTTQPDEKIVWCAQANKERILRLNVSSTFSNMNDFTTEGTLILGGGRLAGGNIEEGTRLVGKIVTFDLFNGDKPVLSFVPCKNADGVCGFWDNISEQFFTTISDTPLQWSFI